MNVARSVSPEFNKQKIVVLFGSRPGRFNFYLRRSDGSLKLLQKNVKPLR